VVDLVELLDVRPLKQKKNKKDYEARKWNERLMTSASCRAFGFSSRCVDNEEEDWEHLGRSGKDVFGCGYTLVGAQCKDFMVTTRGKN
jgi:hypothetical protein